MVRAMLRCAVGSALLVLCSCAGFKSLERGEWVLAYSEEVVKRETVGGTELDVVKAAPGAKQVVISQEQYEAELRRGTRRKFTGTFAEKPPEVFAVKGGIELKQGAVRELRIDEPAEAKVSLSGNAVQAYWSMRTTVDEWRNNQPIERSESRLYLVGSMTGESSLRVEVPGKEPLTLPVKVLGP